LGSAVAQVLLVRMQVLLVRMRALLVRMPFS
jgi:hypothetical protein